MPRNDECIGLFGGTFDPVHHGHLIIARSVMETAGLDRIVFIPSARPPHKGAEVMFDASDRLSFLTLAIRGTPRFTVSDIELRRDGPSYTIDTIREFKTLVPPETRVFFLVGMDNLHDMVTWKDPQGILDECTVLVAERTCRDTGELPGWLSDRAVRVPTPSIDISSSEIRARIREGKSIRFLVPEAVEKAIGRVHGRGVVRP
jgi:nicotinate-nucleotide adenylyltransferase